MYQLEHQEAKYILNLANVKEHCDEYRLKGFAFTFDKEYDVECVYLRGKIPYALAKEFYDEFKPKFSLIKKAREHITSELFSSEAISKGMSERSMKSAKQIADTLPTEKLYFTSIELKSVEELRFIIETIRKNSYVNEWAYGND